MVRNLAALSLFLLSYSLFATVRTLPGFRLETIYSGLKDPLDMKFSPEGDLWITGRAGDLWIYTPSNGQKYHVGRITTDILDKEGKRTPVDVSGERGMHGIEFDPDFLNNKVIYLYYAVQKKRDHFNQVGKWRMKKESGRYTLPEKEEQILIKYPSTFDGFHEGGAIDYNPKDKCLYITAGDNHASPKTEEFYLDPKSNPQNLDDMRGKVHRINLDGTIPKDNPFVGKKDHKEAIYSYGHRNPYTMSIDPKTGNVFVGEVGYDLKDFSMEEVNWIVPGGNYGWPACSGTNQGTFGGPCTIKGAINPFMEYRRFDTGSIVIGPFLHKELAKNVEAYPFDGGFFYMDFIRQWVRFAKVDYRTKKVVETKLVAAGIPERPLGIRLGPDGALYILQFTGWVEDPGKKDQISRISFDKWRAPTSDERTGSFPVAAWLETGTEFKNTQNCTLTVRFEATGEWNFAPGQPNQTAAGGKQTGKEWGGGFLLPSGKVGGLVLRRENGTYEWAGVTSEIKLKAGETIAFLNNDVSADVGGMTFDDNEGSLTLKWSHQGCP